MQTLIEKQIRINQPYWRKVNLSLFPAQLQSWRAEQEKARRCLAGIKHPIPVRLVQAYLRSLNSGGNALAGEAISAGDDEIDPAYQGVHRALVSCQVLRIPFQTVVDEKLPDDPPLAAADKEIAALRSVNLGLDRVATAEEVVEYFRKLPDP